MEKKKGKEILKPRKLKYNFEKGLENEIHEVEAWVKHRRKFFIKLAWVVGSIVVLLVVLNFL